MMDVTDIQVPNDVPVFPMCMECMLSEQWPNTKNVESVYVFCKAHCVIEIKETEGRILVMVRPKE
jgi:hypothetical protein